MVINNKLESIKMINQLELNKFPEQLFSENDTEKVKKKFRYVSSKIL